MPKEESMIRNSFAWRLKPGMREAFGRILRENWEAISTHLVICGFHNFSVWNAEDLLFGYFETDYDLAELKESRKEPFREWNRKLSDCIDWISEPWKAMRLMYQDFGIVRSEKDLIRHRVFMTRLKPGMEEEYKRRHDALIEARGKKITPGPDSNFSIWYAGGYIFGYDEIDTTMERDRTQADIDADIAWETRMFEIMDWITNDVDWISGEVHAPVRLICQRR